MARPYERIEDFVVADATKVQAMDYPSRVGISKIRITGAKNGAYNVTVYTRAFSGAAAALKEILNTSIGKTALIFHEPHGAVVGDTITVASNTVVGYNVAHLVQEVIDDYTVVTDQTYTVDGFNGTGTPSIPSARYGNYEFAALKAADTDHVYRYDEPHGTPFVNGDPLTREAQTQKIYFLFSVTDTYRVTVTSLTDWHG